VNLERLHAILHETTAQFRKGEAVTVHDADAVRVVEFYDMPHEKELKPGLVKVDCHFVTVAVDAAKAETLRAEFIDLLRAYPHPDRLAAGPSYIEVGGELGDQGAALQFFALGQALGLWKVVTPALLGFSGAEADMLAGSGLVMMTGWKEAA